MKRSSEKAMFAKKGKGSSVHKTDVLQDRPKLKHQKFKQTGFAIMKRGRYGDSTYGGYSFKSRKQAESKLKTLRGHHWIIPEGDYY